MGYGFCGQGHTSILENTNEGADFVDTLVTYTYEETPEPASFLLFGGALMGLAASRLRRA